jgi:putative heme-binding domain-containing protein
VATRIGISAAVLRARSLLQDDAVKSELRLSLIQLLAELGDSSDSERILKIAIGAPETLQLAALDALPYFDVPDLPTQLLPHYDKLSARVRGRLRQVLLSRKQWARRVLQEVDAAHLPAADFSPEQLRVIALHDDKELNELVRKHWGNISSGTAEQKLAEMRRFNNDLNAGNGDPARGHETFTHLCGVCHTLFGEGGKVGPDLTHANHDREFLLGSIVDPSATIRKEYLAYEVTTKDGRILSGVIAEQSGGNLTLATSTGEHINVPQGQIASLRESAVSLMPEDLVKQLKPQELRDLFSYLQSDKPSSPAR